MRTRWTQVVVRGLLPTLAGTACLNPTSRAPEPIDLTVNRSAAEALQVAAATLGVNGFDVATADKRTVTATRARMGAANDEILACPLPNGTVGKSAMRTVITVVVATKPVGPAQSEATIRSSVATSFPGLAPRTLPDSGTADCVSNGVVERRVADALRAGSTAE